MKPKLTLSRDGVMRRTYRLEVRLSDEEALRLRETYQRHFEETDLPSVKTVIGHLYSRGVEEFWAAAYEAINIYTDEEMARQPLGPKF